MTLREKYEQALQKPNVIAFLRVIRERESGQNDAIAYRLMNTQTRERRLVINFNDHPQYNEGWTGSIIKKGPYAGQHTTAAGAYQFIGSTWKARQKELSLTDFSPHSQDLAAVSNLWATGAGQDILDGNISRAFAKAKSQWSSLPGGIENPQNQAQALALYESMGGTLSPNDAQLALEYKTVKKYMKSVGVDVGDDPNPNSADINYNFELIENNIYTGELDNVDGATWGGSYNLQEESGYIGLKQFLLYLITRYYPQTLIPFVELIPVYTQETAKKTSAFRNATTDKVKSFFKNLGFDSKGVDDVADMMQTNKDKDDIFAENRLLVEENRFDRSAGRLLKLSSEGGTDLTGIDPFMEYSDSFNTPNENAKQFEERRGFGYKIFGNISLSPSIQGDELSKAGAIGLKSIDIELGSQVHFGMSLITVKFVDVQGNKFLDINSPWSFILNSRPGMGTGGDFYFRYGWQITIPDPNRIDDEQGKRFWNHPGWASFGAGSGNGLDQGEAMKKFVQDIASRASGTITLSQMNSIESMTTPGYMLDAKTGEFVFNRQLNFKNYDTLTLINPELAVNPTDGSIEATLFFRTNSAVGNCLALLNGTNILPNPFETKTLAATGNTNLLALMTAFVNDNKTYITNSPGMSSIMENDDIFLAKIAKKQQGETSDWLTVVGGAGTDSLTDVKPAEIPIEITEERQNEINNAKAEDTTLLINWLYKVLDHNNLTMIVAAGEGNKTDSAGAVISGNSPGGFIIAYDSEKTGKVAEITTRNDLAIQDPSYAYFRKYNNSAFQSENFVGNRLFTQDDVFAFRFQGSLIESMNVEKLEQPTQATMAANQAFAEQMGETNEDKDKTQEERDKETDIEGLTDLTELKLMQAFVKRQIAADVSKIDGDDLNITADGESVPSGGTQAARKVIKNYRWRYGSYLGLGVSDNPYLWNFNKDEGVLNDNRDGRKSVLKIIEDMIARLIRKNEEEKTKNRIGGSAVTYADKKRMLYQIYSSMLGLKVEAICHPWLRLARPCYVKGMGFFDGKYTIIKVTHRLGNDNKFTSSINACRVLNNGTPANRSKELEILQSTAMSRPGVSKSSARGLGPAPAGIKNILKQGRTVRPTGDYDAFKGIGGGDGGGGGATATGDWGEPTVLLRASLEREIKQLHYAVQVDFREFIRKFEASSPLKVVITDGYRTFKESIDLKAQNSSNAAPGKSMHNYGLAIDINLQGPGLSLGKYYYIENGVQVGVPGRDILSAAQSAHLDNLWRGTGIVAMANAMGLSWGGDSFGSYHDRVHFGFDKSVDMNVLLYLATQQQGNNLALIQGNKVKFT